VLFRLICPFSFSSAFSLLGFIQPAQTGTSTNRTAGKEISGYSSSLLALATRKKIPAPGPLAFGESNVKARINNNLDYKRPAFWAIFSSIAAVIILAFLLLANPVSGYSIYEHPETFLGQNSLRAPAKVRIINHLGGDEYLLTDASEIALVTAIVEDMRISKKELSKARGRISDSRYAISYYEELDDSISEYRYTVYAAPVWIDNNVKPSYRFNLINREEIFKRLEEVFAGKDGRAAYDIDALLKNKTLYIGDNSRVVALIDALPLPRGITRGMVELATADPPYGVTIDYNLEDDSVQIGEEQFLRNSMLLFALIGNVEEVTHRGFWNNKMLSSIPINFTYTRADAERVVAGDLRQFAENRESLAELLEIIQMLKEDHD
jgi:hypothetical protein